MNISKYTVELTQGEMFDLAYALEAYIEKNIMITSKPKDDSFLNEFSEELRLLETFTSRGFGYRLTVSKKSDVGTLWEPGAKTYDSAEEWLTALLKQRRKEYDTKNNTTK